MTHHSHTHTRWTLSRCIQLPHHSVFVNHMAAYEYSVCSVIYAFITLLLFFAVAAAVFVQLKQPIVFWRLRLFIVSIVRLVWLKLSSASVYTHTKYIDSERESQWKSSNPLNLLYRIYIISWCGYATVSNIHIVCCVYRVVPSKHSRTKKCTVAYVVVGQK